MARVTLRIQGLDKLKKQLKKASASVEERLDIELQDSRNRIRNGARQRTPGDLGQLKASWAVGGSKLDYTVTNDKFYAPYVEFGTGRFAKNTVAPYEEDWKQHAMEFKKEKDGFMPATPMLYPAVKEEELKLPKLLENAIEDELNRL